MKFGILIAAAMVLSTAAHASVKIDGKVSQNKISELSILAEGVHIIFADGQIGLITSQSLKSSNVTSKEMVDLILKAASTKAGVDVNLSEPKGQTSLGTAYDFSYAVISVKYPHPNVTF